MPDARSSGVPAGAGSGAAGPRVIARLGARRALVAGFAVQAVATVSLVFLGVSHSWLVPLLAATFVGGLGNMVAIVGFMVTATTALPDADQGLATGLATMTQQIGITPGIPVLSAVVTAMSGSGLLTGTRTAIGANVAAVLLAAITLALVAARRSRRRSTDASPSGPATGALVASGRPPSA